MNGKGSFTNNENSRITYTFRNGMSKHIPKTNCGFNTNIFIFHPANSILILEIIPCTMIWTLLSVSKHTWSFINKLLKWILNKYNKRELIIQQFHHILDSGVMVITGGGLHGMIGGDLAGLTGLGFMRSAAVLDKNMTSSVVWIFKVSKYVLLLFSQSSRKYLQVYNYISKNKSFTAMRLFKLF